MAKRTGRQRTQLPTCYYEGYLEKRSFKDKTARKLWTCLCGDTLFFFNELRDSDYMEKLNLSDLISITNDSSQDRNLDAAPFNLQMRDGNIKFAAPNAEARELWKGFIHSVTKLSLPFSLNLLPGQIHMLKEAIEKETERVKNVPPPAVTEPSPHISSQEDLPACFYSGSRLEAELQLEKEAMRGNLLLRPGRDGNSYAVSTRQDLDGSSIFKHYRVIEKPDGGFVIQVGNPVPCATLQDVINYLVEKTQGVLIPLIIEEQYEERISFIWSDDENGERHVQQATSDLEPRSVPPKPAPRIAIPQPAPARPAADNIYLNDKPEEEIPEDFPPVPPPRENKPPKKAMMPPTPSLRKCVSSSSISSTISFTNSPEPKMRVHVETLGQTMSELKLKLEQKMKCQE